MTNFPFRKNEVDKDTRCDRPCLTSAFLHLGTKCCNMRSTLPCVQLMPVLPSRCGCCSGSHSIIFQIINSLILQTSAKGEMQARLFYRQQHHGYYHIHITGAASTHRRGGCLNSGQKTNIDSSPILNLSLVPGVMKQLCSGVCLPRHLRPHQKQRPSNGSVSPGHHR